MLNVNKIYLKVGLPLNPVYASAITKSFQSTIEQLNFSDSPGSARIINSWVEEKTNNKIKNLFEEGKEYKFYKIVEICHVIEL